MNKIAFICGGMSVEKEISCLTGIKVCKELNSNQDQSFLIYLNEHQQFYLVTSLTPTFIKDNKMTIGKFVSKNGKYYFQTKFKKYYFDQVLILGHGKNIEDGTLSCYFQQLKIPCLSESIYHGCLIQDKYLFKQGVKALKIPCLPGEIIYKYQVDDQEVIKRITKKTKFPLIVKPTSLGSSIGISKVEDEVSLPSALFEAFLYDNSLIIEPFISNKREYNIAIIGYENELEYSNIEEVNHSDRVLSFYDKYDYSKNNSKRIINPEIEPSLKEKIISYAKRFFNGFNLCGIIRFDFIYDQDEDRLYLNEANLIPGSLAYYLFEDKYTLSQLVNKYVDLLNKKRKQDKLLFNNYQEGFINKVDITKLKK